MFRLDIQDKDRIYGLDILRSLAILIILLIHSITILPTTVVNFFYKYIIFDGVTLFFVLSGYLIGTTLIKLLENNPIDTKNKIRLFGIYLTRRWFRTLPNYFLILFVLIILTRFVYPAFRFNELYKYFIFSQNLIYPMPDFFAESWSLSIEEWFYLLIPASILLINILTSSVKKAILFVSLLTMVATVLFRYHMFLTIPMLDSSSWDLHFRKEVFTRLDSSVLGALAAYFSFYYNSIWSKYNKLYLIAGLGVLCFNKFYLPFDQYKCVFYLLSDPIGYAFLFPFFTSIKKGRGKWYMFFTYTSLISYSLYLVHFSLINNIVLYSLQSFNLCMSCRYILFWVLSFALAFLLYKYFEVPTTKLRRKLL